MTRYFIGIGSNHQADKNCRLMMQALQEAFGDVQFSKLHKTPAYGIEAPDYLNAVACFESEISRDSLNQWCKSLENRLGRDRQQLLCCADLDILLAIDCDGQVELEAIEDIYFRPLVNELLEPA